LPLVADLLGLGQAAGAILVSKDQLFERAEILTPMGKPPPLAVRLAQALPFRRA
jgi:hypothetical protein